MDDLWHDCALQKFIQGKAAQGSPGKEPAIYLPLGLELNKNLPTVVT